MDRKWTFALALASVAILVSINLCAAAVTIGDAAPSWSGIIGTDDKPHALSDCKDAKLVVLVFTCNHCPVAVAYEGRLVALQKDYKEKGVQVVAVNVNNLAADLLEPMKKRAADKGFNFPYIYDSSQKMGHDYEPKVTPHVFLLDQSRKIAYMGAIDDNMNADKVKKHSLREALDSLLAGKKPLDSTTKEFGCGIKYDKKVDTAMDGRLASSLTVAVAVLLGLLPGGCDASRPRPADDSAKVSVEVIDASAFDRVLARHRGSVVLIDFWATWCGPCKASFPHTVELHRRWAGRGLVVISVSMDDPDNLPAVREFLVQHGADFENFVSRDGAGTRSFETFEIEGGALPFFRLYDRQGVVQRKFSGDEATDPRQIDRAVEELLAKSK